MSKNNLAGIKLEDENDKSNDEVNLPVLDESKTNTIFNILKLPELDDKKEND